MAGETADGGRKNVEITMPLKYLSNFWRIIEMFLINSDTYLLSNDTETITFAITDAKLYVHIITLLTQDNAKLLEQLKSGFKTTINWNKYQSKVTIQAPNPYLDYLTDPIFQGVNRLFVYFT